MSPVPPKFAPYFEQVVRESSRICGDNLRSIILFGSLARGEFSESVSDMDMLFVVSDDTPHATVKKLDLALERLEISTAAVRKRSHFLWVFASRTALFKSHFIIHRSTLLSLDVRRLFDEGEGVRLPLGGSSFGSPQRTWSSTIFSAEPLWFGERMFSATSLQPVHQEASGVFSSSVLCCFFSELFHLCYSMMVRFSPWKLLSGSFSTPSRPAPLVR